MIYLQLFFSFFQIGLFSFGGGYAAVPLIQNQIVNGRGWLSMTQFADLITIAEMTPGPIILNSATFVGRQVAGMPGAVVATLGCVFPSFILVLALSVLYLKYRSMKAMQGILTGLRPAVAGIIGSAGVSLLLLAVFDSSLFEVKLSDFRVVEGGLFLVSLILLRKWKVSPIAVIFGTGIVGSAIYMVAELAGKTGVLA